MRHEKLYYEVKVSSCRRGDSRTRKSQRVFGIIRMLVCRTGLRIGFTLRDSAGGERRNNSTEGKVS